MIFDALRRWMGRGPDGNGDGGEPGTIPCEEALARLYEFLDGELEGVTLEEVDRHFRICAVCYPHLRLERTFREALRRAVEGGTSTPPGLRERVVELTS